VTNAVKHYKHTQVGKRRLHKRPNTNEIQQCRWWLNIELGLVRPALVVAMGASAVQSLFGKALPIISRRGKVEVTPQGVRVLTTIHPSWLLRIRDPSDRHRQYEAFVADFKAAVAAARRSARSAAGATEATTPPARRPARAGRAAPHARVSVRASGKRRAATRS
jgi:uracil-DNA glycosylase